MSNYNNTRKTTPGGSRVTTGPIQDNQSNANNKVREAYEYTRKAITQVSEEDIELWEIIEDVPALESYWPYVVLIANVILPGTGTLLSACLGFHPIWSKTQMVVGFLQIGLSVFLIGWVWSI